MPRASVRRGDGRPSAAAIERRLRSIGDPARAAFAQRYFRTGPGEYGEGDRFLGIAVPVLRRLVREYEGLAIGEARRLLRSPSHEARLLALLVLVRQYARGGEVERAAIYRLYLNNTRHINNWDLVDSSAGQIVGAHLVARSRGRLTTLARSNRVWDRRIAVIATFRFIEDGEFEDSLRLARLLLGDRHDLIHKAVGWMLREVGKRDGRRLRAFLNGHAGRMPRTMLRYAVERFPPAERRRYLEMRRPARA